MNYYCDSVYLKLLNKNLPEVYLEVEVLGLELWISLNLLDSAKLFSSVGILIIFHCSKSSPTLDIVQFNIFISIYGHEIVSHRSFSAYFSHYSEVEHLLNVWSLRLTLFMNCLPYTYLIFFYWVLWLFLIFFVCLNIFWKLSFCQWDALQLPTYF